jgi:hypothetical protein
VIYLKDALELSVTGSSERAAMLLALIWASSSPAGECPSFTGGSWEFSGHLVNSISPGPPDYESVTSGDEPITRWFLQLPWPVCFDEYRYVTKLQLALEPQEVDRYRQFLGKEIIVTGTLEEGAPGDTTSLVVKVSSLVRYRRQGS